MCSLAMAGVIWISRKLMDPDFLTLYSDAVAVLLLDGGRSAVLALVLLRLRAELDSRRLGVGTLRPSADSAAWHDDANESTAGESSQSSRMRIRAERCFSFNERRSMSCS